MQPSDRGTAMPAASIRRFKRLAVILGVAASAAIVLWVVEYAYAPRLLSWLQEPKRIEAPATGSSSPATNPLLLSVFEQPRPIPEIRFQDERGRDLTLADFRGRVLLLNVWATWCVPCRKEMPTLDRLQARLGGKDFLVMALSIDRKGIEAVRGFYNEVGVKNLAIYADPSGKGSHALAIPGVPTTLLIDRDGREVARKMGEAQWDSPEMVSLIERTMRGQSASSAGDER